MIEKKKCTGLTFIGNEICEDGTTRLGLFIYVCKKDRSSWAIDIHKFDESKKDERGVRVNLLRAPFQYIRYDENDTYASIWDKIRKFYECRETIKNIHFNKGRASNERALSWLKMN